MLVRLDNALRAHRRRLMILCTMLVLAASVLSAHSALTGDHMGMGMGLAMCLAVVDTAVAAAMVLASRNPVLRLPRLRLFSAFTGGRPRRAPSPRSRAGPAQLQVFRL